MTSFNELLRKNDSKQSVDSYETVLPAVDKYSKEWKESLFEDH